MLRWDEKKIKNKLEKSKKTRRQKELIDGEFSVFLLKKKNTHTHKEKPEKVPCWTDSFNGKESGEGESCHFMRQTGQRNLGCQEN